MAPGSTRRRRTGSLYPARRAGSARRPRATRRRAPRAERPAPSRRGRDRSRSRFRPSKLQFRSGYRALRSLAFGLQTAFERRFHPGPVVVDHRVPGRVPALTAADDHVLAVDALELGRQRRQRPPRALVLRVGLELDAATPELLEGVSQQEVL